MTDKTYGRIERARDLYDRAAGETFLPPSWQAVAAYIGPLLDVAEAAHELVGVTSHVNVTGPEYADRKLLYAKVRRYLDRLPT